MKGILNKNYPWLNLLSQYHVLFKIYGICTACYLHVLDSIINLLIMRLQALKLPFFFFFFSFCSKIRLMKVLEIWHWFLRSSCLSKVAGSHSLTALVVTHRKKSKYIDKLSAVGICSWNNSRINQRWRRQWKSAHRTTASICFRGRCSVCCCTFAHVKLAVKIQLYCAITGFASLSLHQWTKTAP